MSARIDTATIAAEARRRYGYRITADDVTLDRRTDFRGRRRVYAGSLYIGALDEATGEMHYDRRTSTSGV